MSATPQAPDRTPVGEGGPESTAPSHSKVTRLLCAGTHLNPAFAEAVIGETLENHERFVAPSYGYDVLPVLGHALIARDRRAATRRLIAATLLAPFAFSITLGGSAAMVSIILWVWFVWAAIFFERLTTLQILTHRLKASRPGRSRFDGTIPEHHALTRRAHRRIAIEQNSGAGVIFYGGFQPFVGAGERLKTWSFPVLLDPPEGRSETRDFTAGELLGHLRDHLEQVLSLDGEEIHRIRNLEINRRWYRTAIGEARPAPDELFETSRQGEEDYHQAREYLCIRIGSWDQELVNSLFVGFDIRGRTLYTELHNYVLPPLKASFHAVDSLPEEITPSKVASTAAESLAYMVGEIFAVPGSVLRGLRALFRGDPESTRDLADDEHTALPHDGEIKDFGARRSIREIASSAVYHHFFQSVDAVKYSKIVERRVMELIVEFLESKDVDTTEYRARQNSILNFGILQMGDGKILNSGTMAVGDNAAISTNNKS